MFGNPLGGRPIGMEPMAFDQGGNMSVRITDVPRWTPGGVSDPSKDGES